MLSKRKLEFVCAAGEIFTIRKELLPRINSLWLDIYNLDNCFGPNIFPCTLDSSLTQKTFVKDFKDMRFDIFSN